jgi:predicted transcriptional regulator
MSNNETNASKFITIYNELDKYMKKVLNFDNNVSHTGLIRRIAKKNKIFSRYEDDLVSFAELRNTLVHNPRKRVADPLFEPHDNIVKYYQKILDVITKPPVALDTIAIRSKDVYSASLDSIALNVIKEMNKNTYTHVPVIEEDKIIGVFSENTVFSYIASNEDVLLEKEELVGEFSDFIPLDDHESEYFEFVPKDALIVDIKEKFQKGLKNKKRLSTIFITETGSEKEKLLGLVTAWDLAGYDK